MVPHSCFDLTPNHLKMVLSYGRKLITVHGFTLYKFYLLTLKTYFIIPHDQQMEKKKIITLVQLTIGSHWLSILWYSSFCYQRLLLFIRIFACNNRKEN